MSKIAVVTVVDSIAATSMPINEFVFYRNRENYEYKEILIVCDKLIPNNVCVPKDIIVHLVGNDKRKIKSVTKSILEDAKREGYKCVFHMHAQKSAIQFLSATISLGVRKRTLFTIHSTFSSRDLKYKVSSCLCTLFSNYANCVSEAAYSEYAKWVKIIKGKKFVAIPNGVDVHRIDSAISELPPHSIIADPNVLVCVGRIIPIKNQEFLVRLMPLLPNSKLILIGAEDKTQCLRKLAKELNVAHRVEFKGLVSREEVFNLLNEGGLYVSSSTVEGLPVSVLEAMCVGLLPILSNIAPHNEIREQCPLVETIPLDIDKWIEKIRKYQKMPLKDFLSLSRSIKESVAQTFSLEKVHEEYSNIYKKIIK